MKIRTIVLFVFFGLIIAVLGTFSVLSILSPIKAIKNLNQIYYDTAFNEDGSDESFILEKEAAFLKARTKMSNSDSVCLAINLSDSTVILELQGVMLLKSRIEYMQTSKIFKRIKKNAYLEYLSYPFKIVTDYSTFPKEAFIIKQAPKDTTETAPPAAKPDTLNKEAFCFNLYLDRNFRVDIRQVDTLKNEQYMEYNKYLRKEKISHLIKSLLKFKVPEYEPWIRIDIPANEAKSIFKALPYHAQVAIKL